mmetsp:Transcript_36227/g.69420  ORF Transcript_36227/g.69420 Transcript_36227/m.69420 type:complete len:261 (-) Transcript_36227:4159-4941(-)
MREPAHRAQHPRGVPALAHLLPVQHLPHQHPGGRSQDYLRGPEGVSLRFAAVVRERPHIGPRLLQQVHQARSLAKDAVRPLLLPLRHTPAKKLRPHRMEHPVRIQRERPPHLHAPAQDVPGRIRIRPLRHAHVHVRGVQLRGQGDGRAGPPPPDDLARGFLQPQDLGGQAPAVRRSVPCAAGISACGLHHLHQRASSGQPSRSVWLARERRHYTADPGVQRHFGIVPPHAVARGRRGRGRRLVRKDCGRHLRRDPRETCQ